MHQFRGRSGFLRDFQAVFQANPFWTSFIAVEVPTPLGQG